jgi:hypothetical protein
MKAVVVDRYGSKPGPQLHDMPEPELGDKPFVAPADMYNALYNWPQYPRQA